MPPPLPPDVVPPPLPPGVVPQGGLLPLLEGGVYVTTPGDPPRQLGLYPQPHALKPFDQKLP